MWEFSTPPAYQGKLDWAKRFVRGEVSELDLLHGSAADRHRPATVTLFQSLREEVKRNRMWGPNLPSSVGGSSLGYVELVLLDEVLGTSRWAPSVFGYVPLRSMCASMVSNYGSAPIKSLYLPGLWSGDVIPSYALNEPHVGSVKSRLRTAASRCVGKWVLNGEKWFISDAESADVHLVVARTDDGAGPLQAFTLFAVPAISNGVSLRHVSRVGGHESSLLGYGHLVFEEVELSDAEIVGDVGAAHSVVRASSPVVNIHEQARAVGVMRRCVDLMAQQALSQETDNGRLSEMATTQISLAECDFEVRQYRMMLLYAAWELDQFGLAGAIGTVLALKAALPDIMAKVVSRAAHLHGALGLSNDMPFAQWRAMADSLGVADSVPEACWAELGKLIMESSVRRPPLTWPEDHLPTATTILDETLKAIRSWNESLE